MSEKEYTREKLLEIIERSWLPEKKWENRDSGTAQIHLGSLYALLKAGCEFKILRKDEKAIMHKSNIVTDDETIWIEVKYKGFTSFDWCDEEEGAVDKHTFYLPTEKRLDEAKGKDWY